MRLAEPCVQWLLHMSGMHGLHHQALASLDLNLIVALDALIEERNVTRAAGRVGISQSAMSHALARLRELTGDALLVRGTGGMVLTPRAVALGPPLRRALIEVAGALHSPAPFDPRTTRQRVRISTSDYCELILLPEVVRRLERDAPGIDLRVAQHRDDTPARLAAGSVDLVIAPLRPRDEAPGTFAKKLFSETFVCVVRRGHPLTKGELTSERYAAASHALISPNGHDGGFVDDALERLGLARRVAVVVPHFFVAPHIVAKSDLVLTLATRVAGLLADPLGLEVLTPPAELKLEGFTMSAVWHETTHQDPAHRFVRDLFAEVAAGI
jgi:DNA-binding transcriptional LysR family regulator